MANLYRVVTKRVFKSTSGKIRCSGGETARNIVASSEANARAAAETDDGTTGTCTEFTHQVQVLYANIISGS